MYEPELHVRHAAHAVWAVEAWKVPVTHACCTHCVQKVPEVHAAWDEADVR